MFRKSTLAVLTALAALSATPDLSSQVVTKTYTKHQSLWCVWFRYCYTLDNRAGDNIVGSFEVDFPHGTGDIDSISTPNGWTATIVPATATSPAKVRFTAGWASRMPAGGGPLGGFCIETKCHPRAVEGLQPYRVFIPGGERGRPSGSGLCSLGAGSRSNLLYGDLDAQHGAVVCLMGTDQDATGRFAMVLAGFPMQAPLMVPGIGELHMDPALILPLAPITLDPFGVGQLQLPIPPDPQLGGLSLMLQSVTVDTGGALEMSNGWPLQIR